jgi:hypothetical protein
MLRMEPEQNELPQTRLFWVLLTIFGALFATGPFIFFQSIGWGTFYTLFGLGGLIVLIRDRFRGAKERAQGVVRRVPVRTSVMTAAVVGVSLLVGQMVYTVFSLRSDFNKYVVPRVVTAEQADKLREYLSKKESYAVSIEVVPNDQEAMEYTGQLFNALRQTNWDINPPNHGGPNYIRIPRLRRPKSNDVGSDGKPLYPDNEKYLEGHDEWLESEIDRSITERTYPDVGLSIQVELPGQPTNTDPKHPTSEAILRDAMQYAGIEVNGSGLSAGRGKYSVVLRVGHRPLQLGTDIRQSAFFRLGRWIMDLGR